MKTAKIIVCCHKRDVMAKIEPYLPIHVGKALSHEDLGIQADNDGENISVKNRSYCELTGLYWAWWNLKDVDVVGLCHYRRYFDFHKQCDSLMPDTTFPVEHFEQVDLSIPQSIIDNLQDGEVYVAKPKFYRHSLFDDYCNAHISDDIRKLEDYIMTSQPMNIRKAWFIYMHCRCQLSHYNMFLMTHHDFNDYCEWIFGILSEMENYIDITHYTPTQGRVFGYMAERLMNVWLLACKFKLHELPIIMFTDFPPKGLRSHWKYYVNLLRSRLAVALTCGKYNSFAKTWEGKIKY